MEDYEVPEQNRLRELRLQRGWTQAKVRLQMKVLAVAKGSPIASADSLKAMYSGWENQHHLPDSMYRELLALVFDVSESELFRAPEGVAWAEDDPEEELRRRLLVSRTIDGAAVSLFQAQTNRLRLIDRRRGARAGAE